MTERHMVTLTVNGVRRTAAVTAGLSLLDMVRDIFDLTGSKECCAEGECGACTVILDHQPVNACLVLAVETDGSEVVTIEGVGAAGPTRLQRSFLETGAVQCGFCIPGMVVAAAALLERTPTPTLEEVREGLSGNLCRCGGYSRICAAVLQSAQGSTHA